MLKQVGQQLDSWIVEQNVEAGENGWPWVNKCRIRVLGQTALLEQPCELTLAATNDVDCYADYEWVVEQHFRKLLQARGKQLDPLGHEIWMPAETEYRPLFAGQYVTLLVADLDAVLCSKALKAPHKNRNVLLEYLAKGASERFLQLASKYEIDLEQFV